MKYFFGHPNLFKQLNSQIPTIYIFIFWKSRKLSLQKYSYVVKMVYNTSLSILTWYIVSVTTPVQPPQTYHKQSQSQQYYINVFTHIKYIFSILFKPTNHPPTKDTWYIPTFCTFALPNKTIKTHIYAYMHEMVHISIAINILVCIHKT